MERLLVAVENTDGFTFSVTEHIPVVFSSKEEFLITLEDKIKEIQEKLKEHQEVYDSDGEKIAKKLYKAQKEKNMSEKEHDKLNGEIQKMMLENNALYAEMNQMQDFMLGGQTFSISDFVSHGYELDKREEYINLPQVYTLDEYFEEVEKNLTLNKPKI
jgi:predicted nuclease with TOPRIM domain